MTDTHYRHVIEIRGTPMLNAHLSDGQWKLIAVVVDDMGIAYIIGDESSVVE